MSKVYLIHDDAGTEPIERYHCKNEDLELQQLLERNPDLLPGEQIDPDDPRRWLLVKREMDVPDPNNGASRWKVDFFFLDQDAVPTFVECKRFEDTRARREVVGQIIEYAANGRHYWTADQMHRLAAQTSASLASDLDRQLAALRPIEDLAPSAFFVRAEENLRDGAVRLVFFLDRAPRELKSMVEFLNEQLTDAEVCLVEARQYDVDGQRIVAPVVFGYTEKAHRVKLSDLSGSGARRRWDESRFFDDANRRLAPNEVQALRDLYALAQSLACELTWGTGKDRGSFSIKDSALCERSLLSAFTNGTLWLNFGWMHASRREEEVRDRFATLIKQRLGLSLPDDYPVRFPAIRATEWVGKAEQLATVLRQILSEFRSG